MFRRALPLLAVSVVGVTACTDSDSPVPTAPVAEAPIGPPGLQQEQPIVPGQLLVRFLPGAAAGDLAAAEGASVQRELGLGILVLNVPAGAEARVAAALARNPNVEFAEPDYIHTFGTPAAMPVNDPFIGYKWDLDNDGSIYNSSGQVIASTGSVDADMDWREAVEQNGFQGGSAVIGIIDTGIRHDHEEFQGRIQAGYDFFAGDANPEDDHGHGSHVAGIAAADANNGVGVAGVAFAGDVGLVIAKVCGPTSGPGPFSSYGCPSSAITDGILFAVDNGAHVLNLSLGGGTGSSATQSALQHARANDVLPFCAAGNDGGSVSYPAAFPECVAVSATNWSDGLASYSNFGSQVELSAPGGDGEHPDGYSYILSAYNGSSSSYAFMAGTSMASPQAAGAAALLRTFGVIGAEEILSVLKSTADDLGPAGTDSHFGAGRINLAAALGGVDGGGGPTNAPPTASFVGNCTDLACDFTDTSTDSDGTVVAWSWAFGDGATSTAQNPSHSYAAGGTYTVSLTVTDDDGASDSSSGSVTVSAPSIGGITLQASGYKVRGVHTIDLSWSGASGAQVDIHRNGSVVTTANDGAYTDSTGNRGGGSYTYQVCEAGTSTCSSVVTVSF